MAVASPDLSAIDVHVCYWQENHHKPNLYQVHLYDNLPPPPADAEILAATGAMSTTSNGQGNVT